jgi:Asp-tRNA(Asn)/Glu-tRNA(Gln) amidotransferase A subunit family amidase
MCSPAFRRSIPVQASMWSPRNVSHDLTVAAGRDGGGGVGAAAAVVGACLERMEQIEPSLRAFVPESDRRSRLLSECEALPSDLPLRGALVGVKDIIDVSGFVSRCGSHEELLELRARQLSSEAPFVTRLREAGCLIAGKTVTTEFAGMDAGCTSHPVNPNYTPGGSSSGSAAAVAAGQCHFAIGTQTGGSVCRPASFCGVVGLKPSFGRVETEGVAIFSQSADVVGFFAPDVASMRTLAPIVLPGWDDASEGGDRGSGAVTVGVPDGAYLRGFSEGALAEFEARLAALAALADCGPEGGRTPPVVQVPHHLLDQSSAFLTD